MGQKLGTLVGNTQVAVGSLVWDVVQGEVARLFQTEDGGTWQAKCTKGATSDQGAEVGRDEGGGGRGDVGGAGEVVDGFVQGGEGESEGGVKEEEGVSEWTLKVHGTPDSATRDAADSM